MAHALSLGYATVGTDAGHTGDQMEFGRAHPEKIADWAYRAVHVMTEAAKLLIRDHTGKLPTWSYFDGCSTGGQQALWKPSATQTTTTASSPATPATIVCT